MNKKGFTLLEIILSLAIFAIMSVGFLSVFSTIFINTYSASVITEETFEAQRILEEQILDVKKKLINNDHSSITVAEETYVLFSSYGINFEREVIVYPLITLLSNGASVETLVSQVRPPQLIVPVIESPVLITADTTLTQPFPNIGMSQLLSVNGHTPANISNEGYLIHMLNYWYLSSDKYYIPHLPPEFPDKFSIIPGLTDKVIPTINDSHAGKFVQLMMTPVGEQGQIGRSVPSNPVLISRMPSNTNLLLHLDASFINVTSETEVFTSGRVKLWKDIGPSRIMPTAIATENQAPLYALEQLGSGESERNILSLQSNSPTSTQNLTINTGLTNNPNLTMYFAVRFYENSAPGGGIADGITLFNANSSNSNRKFVVRTNSNGMLEVQRVGNNTQVGNQRIVAVEQEFRTGEWGIFKVDLLTSRTSIHSELANIDGNYAFSQSVSNNVALSHTINLNNFQTSFSKGYNIGEVLIYNGSHDDQAILEYLFDKYILE